MIPKWKWLKEPVCPSVWDKVRLHQSAICLDPLKQGFWNPAARAINSFFLEMSPFPGSLAHSTGLSLAGFLWLAEPWLVSLSRTGQDRVMRRSRPLSFPQASAIFQGLPLNMSDHSCYGPRSPSHPADRHIVGCKLAPALKSWAVHSKLSSSFDFPRDSSQAGSSKFGEKLTCQSLLIESTLFAALGLSHHHIPGLEYNYFKHRVASNHATVYVPK